MTAADDETGPAQRERIVNAAIALAETHGWERVRLHHVAAALDVTLDDVRRHFREKDEIIDAFFDRADAAMLRDAARAEMAGRSTRERLHRAVMAWLETLAPHREVTRAMIGSKLEPGHLHIQIPALMRVSRTVQWMREAAGCEAAFVRRAFEEAATTSIYLATFFYWMRDESPGAARTSQLLDRLLAAAERAARAADGIPVPAPSEPSGSRSRGRSRGRTNPRR